MLITLTGLLQDGSLPRAGVLSDARRTVIVPLHANLTINMSVVSPNGHVLDLSGVGTSLLLQVMKRPNEDIKLKKTATIAGKVATFTVTPADSKNLLAGYYVYDVWLTLAGLRDAVIPLSSWVFSAETP